MPLLRSFRHRHLPLTCLLAFAVAANARAADDISTWQCLPEETAVALRIPNGQAVADAFVKNTKFGAVFFSEERRKALADALAKSNSEEWSEFQKQLADYGLTTDELLKFFAGESGYAVLVSADGDNVAQAYGVAWLQPGEQLAERAYGILARAIEEQEDAEHAIVRIDTELNGRPVMQLMFPEVTSEPQGEIETPEGYEQMSDEEREAAWDEAYERWQESAVEKVSYGTVMLTHLGSRVLLVHGFRQDESSAQHSDAEPLAEIFTRLLAAHKSGEGAFLAKVSGDQAVSRVLAQQGVDVIEGAGDVAALMPLLRSAKDESGMGEKAIRILGLDGLGPFAFSSSLEGILWHSQMSLAMANPRQGIWKMLDQSQGESDPPAWVPASAITFGLVNFDLGKAYEVLREEIVREFPEQAGQYFGMAEMQVMAFAQASLADVLSSLGTRHVMLNFETQFDTSESAGDQPENTAVVWQVTDPQIWTRILQGVAPMIGSMPGAEVADEQGYHGIRFKNEFIEGGLFLGNGNLVLAYGPDVLEKVLSSLNNPPDDAGSFRGGAVFRRAAEMLDPTGGMTYKVVDGNRYAEMIHNVVTSALAEQEQEVSAGESDADGEEVYWMKVFANLMPSKEEMKGMLGVIASRWEVSDHGVLGTSVQEMPAP